MAIQPQTIASEIEHKIEALVQGSLFVSKTDPRVVSLLDELYQLEQADSHAAVVHRASLLQMTGDLDAALREIERAPEAMPAGRLRLLANYSHCLEAQEIYRNCAKPSEGEFSLLFSCGIASGAFHQIAEFAEEARKMNLTNLEKLPLEAINMSSRLLAEFGVSDLQTGSVMQTAGKVLREHGMLFFGEGPDIDAIDVPGELRTVQVTYRLPVPPVQAVEMYMDFVDRLDAENQDMPSGFHISFSGVAA